MKLLYLYPPKPSLSIFVLRGLFNSEFFPNDSIKGHGNSMHTDPPDDSQLRALVPQRQAGSQLLGNASWPIFNMEIGRAHV